MNDFHSVVANSLSAGCLSVCVSVQCSCFIYNIYFKLHVKPLDDLPAVANFCHLLHLSFYSFPLTQHGRHNMIPIHVVWWDCFLGFNKNKLKKKKHFLNLQNDSVYIYNMINYKCAYKSFMLSA